MSFEATESASRLSVRSRPSRMVTSFVWLIFLAYTYWVLPSPRLHVQRTGPGVATVIIDDRLLGMTRSRRTVERVTGADVQTRELTRVVLRTASGIVPVSASFSVGAAHHEAAAADLNAFLRQPEPASVQIPVRASAWLWLGAGFLALVCLSMTFVAPMECTLDRNQDSVVLASGGALGRRSRVYRLSEVERFQVLRIANRDRVSRDQRPDWFNIGFRLRTGEEIAISRVLQATPSDETYEMTRRLENFRRGLGPRDRANPPSEGSGSRDGSPPGAEGPDS